MATRWQKSPNELEKDRIQTFSGNSTLAHLQQHQCSLELYFMPFFFLSLTDQSVRGNTPGITRNDALKKSLAPKDIITLMCNQGN